MKITITFKTPDATAHLDENEKAAAEDVISKFLRYEELVVIEFDTEALTAEVKPRL